MGLKEIFLNFRDKYMTNEVERMNIPQFPPDEMKRYQIIFSGTVQGVGFRYEAWMIAEKLKLTGFAQNLPNGDVLMEVQGPKNRIDHLLLLLGNVRRFYIENKEITELPLKEETEFMPVY